MNETAENRGNWREAVSRIAARAGAVDVHDAWPGESLADLTACGAMGWAVPREEGGSGLEAVELHRRYEAICGACMTTGLAFTQRDSAVGLLARGDRSEAVRKTLGELAAGKIFATIGISQLTTSRQHLPPAVRAERAPRGYVLDGAVPWVTSLHHSERIIVGAVLADRQQILVALNSAAAGVELGEPMKLAALTGSDTGEIKLRRVFVEEADLLRGPCENALAGPGREFGLTPCVLPLGVAAAAVAQAAELARTQLCVDAAAELKRQLEELRERVYAVGVSTREEIEKHGPSLRAEANSLASRATLAALELAKGHGFVAGEAAQRRAREALFFFVWSSPRAVMEQTLAALAKHG